MRRGQGNTEFIVIVALIAIATIGIITIFGDNIRGLFAGSSDSLGGDEVGNNAVRAEAGATDKNMSNFADQSSAYEAVEKRVQSGGATASGQAAASPY